MIPRGRFRISSALTSGTTRGTSGSIRNAPELSTATAPRAAATGAHCAETSSGTSNTATPPPPRVAAAPRAPGGRDGCPLCGDLVGHVEHRDVHPVEALLGERDDLDLLT